MSSNSEKQLTALEKLQQVFSDRPDILKLLDPRNLDENSIEGEAALGEFRTGEGFASPVNFYVTGRTRAGKTSLGNTLLDGSQVAMPTLGKINCTDRVGCFKLSINLCYFDLPGAGARESYENINRAALSLPQIEDRRTKMFKIQEFILSDYTKYAATKKTDEKTVTVESWQSSINQNHYYPDVILYIIAPHDGFGRDDERYMWDLLELQKERLGYNNVIFALNLHSINGQPKYTSENIKDVRMIITDVYQQIYTDSHDVPPIVEINSLTGSGVNKITEQICKLLPVDKLGKMEQVLGVKLKQIARSVQSRRFQQALICVASRLATRKVSEPMFFDDDMILEAYTAIYTFAAKVFRGQDTSTTNVHGGISELASETKKSREDNLPISKPILGMRDIKGIKQEPVYGKIEESKPVPITETYIDRQKRRNFISQFVLGDIERVLQRTKIKDVTTKSFGITGMKDTEVVLGSYETVVGTKEEKILIGYHKGGYPIIEGILSIGLGMADAASKKINTADDALIFKHGKEIVQSNLTSLKSKIEEIVENQNLTPKQAEAELIQLLESVLIEQ
jgi:hypothetical protein